MSGTARSEPGSFRDPDSRVFYVGDTVYRGLSEAGLADWEALAGSPLLERLMAEGKLVATERVERADLPHVAANGYAAVLRHERVPFVSYPYEWTFSMLRDAALLQLEVLRDALDAGLILKDATPYNMQWRGSRPVFVDVGSFERLRPGEPWTGYRQFCMQYLNPLLLQAYRGIDLQFWLRGRLEGIPALDARRVLRGRDLLRRGVLTHVVLHARLERRYADRRRDVRRELRAAGFHEGLIRASVARLERLVRSLRWRRPATVWLAYRDEVRSYEQADAERKAAVVREVAAAVGRRLVWDLGCNDGRHARLAAEHADTVLALDADHAVVDTLYETLRAEGNSRVLPLCVDVADPSPGLGWRGRECSDLFSRGRPDLTLCLALVHHLAITRNVPLDELVDWLASIGSVVVVEFPTPEDPMVQRLLTGKREGLHAGYRLDVFERLLSEAFAVERREELLGGKRVLFVAAPRR